MTTLLDRIDEMLSEDPISRVRLRVPQKEGKLLALLEARSRIYSREYKGGIGRVGSRGAGVGGEEGEGVGVD